MVEPQNWLKNSFEDLLQNPNIKYEPCGAGKEDGSFLFTISDRDDSSSFIYSKEEAEKNGFKQIEIPVYTVNNLCKKYNLKPDLIKIDAEGLDIEVLDGASDWFGKTEVFMVEATIRSKAYPNTLQKMINYMDSKGYEVFDFTDLNRPFEPNILWLVEIVFVKRGGIIDKFNMQN